MIVEPKEGERGLTQRKVGMYQCGKCGTKFPTVVSRQRYLLVAEEQLTKIKSDVQGLKRLNQELDKRIDEMNTEQQELHKVIERTAKNAEVKQLEASVRSLERELTYLRKEKGELEEKVSRYH